MEKIVQSKEIRFGGGKGDVGSSARRQHWMVDVEVGSKERSVFGQFDIRYSLTSAQELLLL